MEINTNELISFFDKGYFNLDENIEKSAIENLSLKKSDVFVLCASDVNYLENEEKVLLENILKAVGIKLEEVNIIVKSKIALRDIINKCDIKTCLLFGYNPKDVAFYAVAKLYQTFKFKKTTFLFADSLKKINSSDTEKKYLWHALQQIFK